MKGSQIISLLLIIGLLVSVTSHPVLANVTDVPSDHWAYQAVVSLVNKGYLSTYEDGSFKGANSVDRYTFATTIAQILDEISTRSVVGSMSDADILRDLTSEFRTELVQFYADQESIDQTLEETLKKLTATDERVSNVVANQVKLEEDVARLKADLMMEAMEAANTLCSHQTILDEQQIKLDDQQANLDILENAVISLEEDIRLQSTSLSRLENWSGEKDAVFAMIDAELSTLVSDQQEQIDQLVERKNELELDLLNLAVSLQNEKQNRVIIEEQLANLQADVGVSEEELAQLNKKISDEIAVQMNAALIRERGLSGNLQELEAEFERYQETSEREIRSAKSTAIIAIAAAAVGIVLNFVR